MRILAKAQGVKYSPVIVLVLALAIFSVIGQRTLIRGVHGAAVAGENALEWIRIEVEPTVFVGGLFVSRSRHVIAGAAMGCVAGGTVGAGSAAVLGAITGGIGLATLPPAAGIGCLLGAGGGIAIGYPLDSWSLAME